MNIWNQKRWRTLKSSKKISSPYKIRFELANKSDPPTIDDNYSRIIIMKTKCPAFLIDGITFTQFCILHENIVVQI